MKRLSAFLLAGGLLCGATPLSAQVPLQPDWSNLTRAYGPVDGVASAWADGRVVEPYLQAADPPSPTPEPNLRVSILAGGLASISADASGVAPMARIRTEARLTKSAAGPSLHVVADLTALPGESVALEDPQTFKALEFSAGISQPLPGPLLFALYAEGGFASRLPADTAPRDRSAKWAALGFLFQTKDRAHRLALGIGRDQRLSGQWVTAVTASGHVKLREERGISVYLVGSAVLSMETELVGNLRPVARDSIRIGVAVGL